MRRATIILAWSLLSLTITACSSSPTTPSAPERYRILVTNDDGIDAPGIKVLVAALEPLGEVVVVAPTKQQSGMSHAVSIIAGIQSVRLVEHDGVPFGHAVDGTPADSVLVGLYWLSDDQGFDIVVSGINYGTNVGTSSLYSGTVGAALEGALRGVPAVAISQDHRRTEYTVSAAIAAQIVERVLEEGLTPGTFLNVNVPEGELRGIRVARMDPKTTVVEGMEPMGSATDGSTGLRIKVKKQEQYPPDSDAALFLSGYVTVTPLQADWTAKGSIKPLQSWKLQLPESQTKKAAASQ